MRGSNALPWALGLGLALFMAAAPYIYYRHSYTHARRLRPVEEGKVYRSGRLTADGLREALQRHKFRTVLNLMDEEPDPDLEASYFNPASTRESELCAQHGARLIPLTVDVLHASELPHKHPAAIDAFRKIMDDPASYPVLIHCKAGLHRTGCVVAVYRMEYNGWSRLDALRELKANGFGEIMSVTSNPYILQYIRLYEPRGAVTTHHSPLTTHP